MQLVLSSELQLATGDKEGKDASDDPVWNTVKPNQKDRAVGQQGPSWVSMHVSGGWG